MTTATRPDATTGAPPRPQFADFSIARQLWEGIGCAAIAGAVSGWALGTNVWFYLATAGIAAITGVPAATQHATLRGALIRCTVGGFVWAAAVLGIFLALGHSAVVPLPDPVGLYLVTTTAPAMAVGWAVWSWTNRVSASRAPLLRPSRTAPSPLPGVPLPARVGAAPLG